MDINSIDEKKNVTTEGGTVPCPKCGEMNKSECAFCIMCGAKMPGSTESKRVAAFETVLKKDDVTPEKNVAANQPKTKEPFKYVPPASAFAQGLPEWSIEPPQVMVRRK